jgi:hypothetical protein
MNITLNSKILVVFQIQETDKAAIWKKESVTFKNQMKDWKKISLN